MPSEIDRSGPAQADDQRLLPLLRRLHQQAREEYGAIKRWRAAQASGLRCGRHRIARLRKLARLDPRRIRRFRVVVEHHQLPPPASNLLQQRVATTALNRVWGDFTLVATRGGVALCRDPVGFVCTASDRLGDEQQAGSTVDARCPGHGGVPTAGVTGAHSSLGPSAQYSCLAYQRQLTTLGMTPSMSRKGNCYDNAVTESFFSTLKNELVHHQPYTRGTRRAERSLPLLKCSTIASGCIKVWHT